MFAQNLLQSKRLAWLVPLVALVLSPLGVARAKADTGAYVFDTQTIVSVSNLDLFPPNLCTQAFRLNGDFVIQAHIVYPPGPIFPPGPIMPAGTNVTLQLDATDISAVGLADGMLYQGTPGSSQDFLDASSTMVFEPTFELVPSPANLYPPNPCQPAPLTVLVQIYTAEGGIPAISAALDSPDWDK